MITISALIVFWLSVTLLVYSYAAYPLILRLCSIGKKENAEVTEPGDAQLPRVYIIFSAYNEEKVINEKIESIYNTNYPPKKLSVLVGSDNSTDGTNLILKGFAEKYQSLRFTNFSERGGKSSVLNNLVGQLLASDIRRDNDIFIFTDANVIFTFDLIYHLVKHFKNPAIGQVGAQILNRGVKPEGISLQEKTYIQGENTTKYFEGLNWGAMIGAFGACHAIRANCWREIPKNYLMEDFYLSMNVLEKRKRAICEPKAICYEDVSDDVMEEYKRKSRIQAGNFQNLSIYWPLLFRFDAVSFCFFSHKVIRWAGPAFIFLAWVSGAWLASDSEFYAIAFLLQNILLLSPVIDVLLKKAGINLSPLRFVAYFYLMNAALVNGFFQYAKGVKTNAWSPTKRNI